MDGFTVWEWHKYFSPLGGPQVAENPIDGPVPNTLNSNASLHNFIELLRIQRHRDYHNTDARDGGGARAATTRLPALLRLISSRASYTTDPAPSSGLGRLTDSLPLWNMGGPLPSLQLRWDNGLTSKNGPIRLVVNLSAATGHLHSSKPTVCCAKLFALQGTGQGVHLPAKVVVVLAGRRYTLNGTTANNNATNVFYTVLPDDTCPMVDHAVFEVWPRNGSGVAVSEVELYSTFSPTPHRRHPLESPPLTVTETSSSNTVGTETVTPTPTRALPALLSKRAAALAPSPFNFAVGADGGASVEINGLRFDLTSSFSEVGPHWNNLTAPMATIAASVGKGGARKNMPDTTDGHAAHAAHSWWVPSVNRSGAGTLGRWVVISTARNYSLTRVYQLDPWPLPRRVLVNDTIRSLAAAPIGVFVKHRAYLDQGTVDRAVVPGLLSATYCGTEDNPTDFVAPTELYPDLDPHNTNGGAPHLWFNATHAGGHSGPRQSVPTRNESFMPSSLSSGTAALGLVALDDVFRVHAQCANHAVKQMNPRVASHCQITTPPSIQLSDPNFALPAGDKHTLEWAIYPFSNCTDWFCFVNALRHDFGTEDIVIGNHTGVLSGLESGIDAGVDDMTQWARSGYGDPRCNSSLPAKSAERMAVCKNWTDWSTPDLQAYMVRQGLNVMPIANMMEWGGDLPCGGHMEMNGAMFVNGENPPTSGCGSCYAWVEEKIHRVVRTAARSSTTAKPVKTSYYIHATISTGATDSVVYSDARVLDEHGSQVLYRPCQAKYKKYANTTAAFQGEMPLFFGTTGNSYGNVLRRYVDKIFALGVDGVFHDEYDYGEVSYTYGTWDRRSAFLHHPDLSLRALPGSITLLSLGLELELREIIRANNGFFTANGPPVTRTIMEGQYGVHFQEGSQHCRVKHVQTYTPVMLNRDGTGQAADEDPKYSRAGNVSGSDVCWNMMNHLDEGVLSYMYEGMFPNGTRPTILQHMWPITVKELGDGFVIGMERVVTKATGTFRNAGLHYTVHVYQDCLLVASVSSIMSASTSTTLPAPGVHVAVVHSSHGHAIEVSPSLRGHVAVHIPDQSTPSGLHVKVQAQDAKARADGVAISLLSGQQAVIVWQTSRRK